jgi:hypothetical protein
MTTPAPPGRPRPRPADPSRFRATDHQLYPHQPGAAHLMAAAGPATSLPWVLAPSARRTWPISNSYTAISENDGHAAITRPVTVGCATANWPPGSLLAHTTSSAHGRNPPRPPARDSASNVVDAPGPMTSLEDLNAALAGLRARTARSSSVSLEVPPPFPPRRPSRARGSVAFGRVSARLPQRVKRRVDALGEPVGGLDLRVLPGRSLGRGLQASAGPPH